MTSRSKFQVENIRHIATYAVAAWLSNFCHLGHLQLKNGVSTKTAKSFKNRGRKVRKKWRLGSKRKASWSYKTFLLEIAGIPRLKKLPKKSASYLAIAI